MNSLVWAQALTLGATIAVLGWALTTGPLRVFSRASRDFLGFNLFVLAGSLCWWPWLLLEGLQPIYRVSVGLMLMLAGVQWLCMGLQKMYDLKPTYVVSAAMLPGLGVLLAAAAWLDSTGQAPLMAFFSACVWMLGVTVQQAFPSMLANGGRLVARWSLLPFGAACGLWLVGMAYSVWLALSGNSADPEAGQALAPALMLDVWQVINVLATWWMLNGALAGLLMLKLLDKIRDLATEDELTGALNLRSFMAMLLTERERIARLPQPQALVVCELDQLNALNKQLGFAAGDAALRHLTGVLGRGLRKTDRLGRSMHGEFLVHLPMTPTMGALVMAERSQAALKAQPLLWNGQSVNLTMSMGISGRDGGAIPCETLVEMARKAVQRAQQEGGGRIRVSQQDSPVPVEPDGVPLA